MIVEKNNKNESFDSQSDQIKILQALLEDENANDRVLEWGGHLALENGHWDLAENIFSSLLERRKKKCDFIYLGESLLNQMRLDEAEECFLEALNHIFEPCYHLFKINKYLGQIHVLKNNYPMAEEHYNRAHTLNPRSLDLQFHRALLKVKEKKYKDAEQLFQKILKKTSDYARAWLGLAISRYKLGEEEMALACLSKCLDLDPHNKKANELYQLWNSPYSLFSSNEHFKFSA